MLLDAHQGLPGAGLLEGKANPASWKPFVRQVLYPVQFENVPMDGIDRVFQQVIDAPKNSHDHGQYLEAIQGALESKEPVGRMFGMDHPEPSVRQFLEAVKTRLQPDPSGL
jgi:hypothetical protein